MEEYSVLQIDIAGNRYQLDAHQENLIPVDRNLAKIPIGNLDVAMEHEWQLIGYYDLINRCLHEPPDDLRALPENVVPFVIPSHHELLEAIDTSVVIIAEIVDLRETELSMKVGENGSDGGMEKEQIDYYGMIVIHGILYEFDKKNNCLIAEGCKSGSVFPEILDWEWDFMSGYAKRNDPGLSPFEDYCLLDQYEKEELKYIQIPQEIMNHKKRESLTEQQIQKFNGESLKNDHGFYFVDAALTKRLKGELPQVQFDGVTYIADLANLQIIQKEKPDVKFELMHSDIYYNADFLYNTRTKTPCRIDPKMSEMPKDTVIIRLSNFKDIDTVGFAIYMKQAPTAFVSEKAWYQAALKAEFIPLHETKIPELMRRNQMEQEKFKTKQTETPLPQRKRSKSM